MSSLVNTAKNYAKTLLFYSTNRYEEAFKNRKIDRSDINEVDKTIDLELNQKQQIKDKIDKKSTTLWEISNKQATSTTQHVDVTKAVAITFIRFVLFPVGFVTAPFAIAAHTCLKISVDNEKNKNRKDSKMALAGQILHIQKFLLDIGSVKDIKRRILIMNSSIGAITTTCVAATGVSLAHAGVAGTMMTGIINTGTFFFMGLGGAVATKAGLTVAGAAAGYIIGVGLGFCVGVVCVGVYLICVWVHVKVVDLREKHVQAAKSPRNSPNTPSNVIPA